MKLRNELNAKNANKGTGDASDRVSRNNSMPCGYVYCRSTVHSTIFNLFKGN